MEALSRFHRCKTGAAAIEFAILAPLFFFLLFGILEIGFVLFFNVMINLGAERGHEHLLKGRQNYQTLTAESLRTAICQQFAGLPISCSEEKLKIGFINTDNPRAPNSAATFPIVNRFDPPSGGQYILAVGYNWEFSFPGVLYDKTKSVIGRVVAKFHDSFLITANWFK